MDKPIKKEMQKPLILLVDDDATFSNVFRRELSRMDFEVDYESDSNRVLQLLGERKYDVLLLDIFLPETDGMTILQSVKKSYAELPVIMLTGYATIDTAIESMKLGAFDYLSKPFRLDEVKVVIDKAIENRKLSESNARLREGLSERQYSKMIGKSKAMLDTITMIKKVAPSDSTVLLMGESGTGKELAARLIHRLSRRAEEPFVIVDCSTLHVNLVESELFGHEKGAYTGASKRKHGLFEVANGGSIFLDEIGEINTLTQSKLLRIIETGKFRRLGGTEGISVDVRVIAATNRNLGKMVADNLFREDLFYRINVFCIRIPPLRERKEDIVELANYFVEKRCHSMRQPKEFSDNAIIMMQGYDWPGNIRELENVVERALVLSETDVVGVDDLPLNIRGNFNFAARDKDFRSLSQIEDEYIRFILDKCNGSQAQAAAVLGVDPKTLYRHLRKNRE
jgi:two-component system response regulator HydG